MKYLDKLIFAVIMSFFSCQEEEPVELPVEIPIAIDSISSKNVGIIVNISADGMIYAPVWGKSIDLLTKSEIIQKLNDFVDSYSKTQVSCLFFNVNYQRSCFPNTVMETYWDINNPELNINSWPKLHWQLFKKGIDPYEVSINRTRNQGISPWISIRMNDHHYFDDTSKINHLWVNNPDVRLNEAGLFDYAQVEVRDYYKAYIKEVLDRYDVDGIELDWMRTYYLFKSGNEAFGAALLNDYMVEIRKIVEAKSLERKHKIKIAVRVPPTSSICKLKGMDVVAWVKQNSVDIVIPSNWYQPSNFDIPIEVWRKEIGVSSSVCLLIPSVDNTYMIANSVYVKRMKSTLEVLRGFAASTFSRGADGICLFNNWDTVYKRKVIDGTGNVIWRDDKPLILNGIGSYNTALDGDRSHVLTYNDIDGQKKPLSAIPIGRNETKNIRIHTGMIPHQGTYNIRIGLDFSSSIASSNLTVLVNGSECKQIMDLMNDPSYIYDNKKQVEFVSNVAETSYKVLQFNVNLTSVKNGYNLISIKNNSNNSESITWFEVYINSQ